jgi:hypothetical protein
MSLETDHHVSAHSGFSEAFWTSGIKMPNPAPELSLPRRHELVALLDIDETGRKALQMTYELQPSSYEELVALRGLGPKSIRVMDLIISL